jgi:plasmid maintenance system killer protein
LVAGLARIRSIMLAEYKADWEKILAAREAKMAEAQAKLEAELAKRVDALMEAETAKVKAL